MRGGGLDGRGEHVGWTDEAHAAFRDAACSVGRGERLVGQWCAAFGHLPPYDRAALEAAAIDLALQQHVTNLFRLAGVRPRPVRYVVSFACQDDPVAEAERLAPGKAELKIDAGGQWTDQTWRGLAALGRVAVIDFKQQGETADHERACRHLPAAWIEDPVPDPACWSPALAARYSADGAVTSVAALDALDPQPAAVNVKPGRMGSVLDAIDCLAHARARQLVAYVGGMFEVGVGRLQLRTLAALACPDGPNDIAPLLDESPRPARLLVSADAAGFAATARS